MRRQLLLLDVKGIADPRALLVWTGGRPAAGIATPDSSSPPTWSHTSPSRPSSSSTVFIAYNPLREGYPKASLASQLGVDLPGSVRHRVRHRRPQRQWRNDRRAVLPCRSQRSPGGSLVRHPVDPRLGTGPPYRASRNWRSNPNSSTCSFGKGACSDLGGPRLPTRATRSHRGGARRPPRRVHRRRVPGRARTEPQVRRASPRVPRCSGRHTTHRRHPVPSAADVTRRRCTGQVTLHEEDAPEGVFFTKGVDEPRTQPAPGDPIR